MVISMPSTNETAEERYIAIFGTRTRFVMMVLVLLCLTSIWSNILCFSFAVICMEPEGHGNDTSINQTAHVPLVTDRQQSYATSMVALAALLANFPVVFIVNKVGIRTVFTSFGILSSVSTLLLPLAIRFGFPYLLIARAVQGIGFASNFPVIGAFCAKWTYYKQSGLFVSALVAYVQLAPAITMPASGALCGAFKWPSIFYAHGAVSLLLFVTYGLFYRNSPQKHPFVGRIEMRKISAGKPNAIDKKVLQAVPYAKILKTPAVWAVWIAAIGNFTCVNMMFLYSPKYLSTVLGFPAHKTGFSAALPPLAQFLSKLLCGGVSDRIHFISEQNKFRLFNSLAFFGSATFLSILAFMGDEHKNFNMVVLGAAAGVLGATTGGFFKAGPVLSKQYSHFVTGNISLGLTITMLVIPFVVEGLTPNQTQEEWKWVFLVVAVVMLLTNLFFLIFIRGEPCAFTEEAFRPNSVRVAPIKTTPIEQKA